MTDTMWLDKKLLRSRVFRSLKKWPLLVYLDFLRKRKMEKFKQCKRSDYWFIKNNGEIVYPYSEAEHKGISRTQFRNAIDALIEHGFLDIAHQGSGGRSGDMTKYIIDDRWAKYGTVDFRPPKNPRKKDTRKGRGWEAYHAKNKKSTVSKSIPEKDVSSDKFDTPKKESVKVTNIKTATPKTQNKTRTTRKNEDIRSRRQLTFWSNDSDTIL